MYDTLKRMQDYVESNSKFKMHIEAHVNINNGLTMNTSKHRVDSIDKLIRLIRLREFGYTLADQHRIQRILVILTPPSSR